MLALTLASLLFSLLQISALDSIPPGVYTDDFVFPLEKSDVFSTCTLENGVDGRCVTLSQCSIAHKEYKSGINPKLCHFEKNEPVVCCKSATTKSEEFLEKRRSAASCDLYSTPVPAPAPVAKHLGELHISVVGGIDTIAGEFPHMAALGWTDENNNINWRCGGALISLDFVLTAAHCVIGTPPDLVRVGEEDLTNDLDVQGFGIESIIGHPEYRPRQFYNDIALIKLKGSAIVTPKVRPACLWQRKSTNFTDVTAVGYGHTEFGGKSSSQLLKVDLKIFTNDECTEGYKTDRSLTNGIIESQLCAGDTAGEKDTCQGDSGGPLQTFTFNGKQTVYHVVGVTSFGKACATTLPGVYTRVSHYLDWIESIVWS